jgi:hypothetical protein
VHLAVVVRRNLPRLRVREAGVQKLVVVAGLDHVREHGVALAHAVQFERRHEGLLGREA